MTVSGSPRSFSCTLSRAAHGPRLAVHAGSAEQLPFPNDSFDLAALAPGETTVVDYYYRPLGTGPLGFRGGRLEERELQERGWRTYWETERTHYAPHYESWLWACFLWAYARTGFAPFLERAATGIRLTMAAYPDEWRWTNGIQQERARMLLALSWLVRVEASPTHRQWLHFMAGEPLRGQASCGAIREELGQPARELPPLSIAAGVAPLAAGGDAAAALEEADRRMVADKPGGGSG